MVKGCQQGAGRDFGDTFAPGSDASSLRVFLATATCEDADIMHIDSSSAFLHGICEEEVYVEQPHGHENGGDGFMCRLHKSLYGLRQAPRAWYMHLRGELSKPGFEPLLYELCMYVRHDKHGFAMIDVHVDDMLVAYCGGSARSSILAGLDKVFKYRVDGDGDDLVFIGLEISRDRPNRSIRVTQTRYVENLAARFWQQDGKGRQLPIAPGKVLSKEGGDPLPPTTPYRELIGSLMYLSVSTRLDISFSVNSLARFMTDPKEQHWKQAISVLQYVNPLGLHFRGGTMEPIGSIDSDFQLP